MSYSTNLGSRALIIDDGNAHLYEQEAKDGQFGTGYVPRNYAERPEGFYAPRYGEQIIPRSRWDDLIKMQEDNESSPWHVFQQAGAPILNQGPRGYCWMFGTVGAIMNRYQASGIEIPKLCATYTAALGKNYRNEGGWGGEAIGYIAKYGIPTVDVCAEDRVDRSLFNREQVKRSAELHGHVEYSELPRQNFDAVASVLLSPHNPRPCTLALMWWGHLVYGLRVVKIDSRTYGIQGPNSWGEGWGDKGTFVLAESKATPHESIAIERVKPRSTGK